MSKLINKLKQYHQKKKEHGEAWNLFKGMGIDYKDAVKRIEKQKNQAAAELESEIFIKSCREHKANIEDFLKERGGKVEDLLERFQKQEITDLISCYELSKLCIYAYRELQTRGLLNNNRYLALVGITAYEIVTLFLVGFSLISIVTWLL